MVLIISNGRWLWLTPILLGCEGVSSCVDGFNGSNGIDELNGVLCGKKLTHK